jgi:hypothetical protein
MVWQNGERWSASSANIPGQRILSVRISVLNVNPTPGMRLEAPSTGSLKRNNPCLITRIAGSGRGRFYPVNTQYCLGIAHFSFFFPAFHPIPGRRPGGAPGQEFQSSSVFTVPGGWVPFRNPPSAVKQGKLERSPSTVITGIYDMVAVRFQDPD